MTLRFSSSVRILPEPDKLFREMSRNSRAFSLLNEEGILPSRYGGGFRAANVAVNKYGLRCTLDHIRMTSNFPL
ncbi:unnamed protein product [Rhodiola kirilowii]